MEKQRWEESEGTWKSRGGKSQRGEEPKEWRSEKRKSEKKEDAGARKGRKVAKQCVFPDVVAPEGRKVGLLKRRVRKHVVRWEMEKCRPLWRETHVQVKMHKTNLCRTTFGTCDVEKVHAVVAACKFGSQNVQCRSTFGSCAVEKVHAVVVRSTFPNQKCEKTEGYGALLDVQMSFCVAGAGDCAPCQKWAKRDGFAAVSKALAGVEHVKRICKDTFSVAGAVQETCSSEMLGSQAADFLREVAFWSIRSSGLLRWFCVTGAALRMTWHHFCLAGAALKTDGVEKTQNALARGHQRCTQLSIIERSLAELLRFRNWGSLAELLRFWRYQVQKLRKSRRLASFFMLSPSKMEEVSQKNSFVFKLADR